MIKSCIVLSFALLNVALADNFLHFFDDSKPCELICENTYTLHTYPTAENLACCQRGCRFFSLLEATHKDDLNATKQLCFSACIDAYSKESESSACSLGCANQFPFSGHKNQEPQTLHLLTPFLMIHSMCSNFLSSVTHMVATFYVQNDTGTMYIVEQQAPALPIKDYAALEAPLDLDLLEDADFFSEQGGGISAVQLTLPQNAKRFGIAMGASSYNNHEPPLSQPQADWLSCISRQSGLPRWLLLLGLFTGVMVMVWLCCSAGPGDSSAPRTSSRKFNFQGDLDYLLVCQSAEEYKIQPPPLYEEAPPLPVKVKLPPV